MNRLTTETAKPLAPSKGFANALIAPFARRWVWALVLAGLLSVGADARSQETSSNSEIDFDAFKLIFERNIFDPDRSSRREEDRPVEQTQVESRPVDVESLILLGTISYQRGSFGFFDGSRADFKKTVPLDELIAGFRVTHIDAHRVLLEADGQRLELPVGKQASKREDEEHWKIMDRIDSMPKDRRSVESLSGSDRAGNREVSKSDTGESGEAGTDEGEILKRLMQQREQELSNE